MLGQALRNKLQVDAVLTLPPHDIMPITPSKRIAELVSALKFIALVAVMLWLPLVWWLTGGRMPWQLLEGLREAGLALMFVIGAIIANATAVGGGMVFNPTLQLAFEVTGLSALALAVLVQSAGMPAGTYGWYKKGEFRRVDLSALRNMLLATVGSAVVFQVIFLWLASTWPKDTVLIMRIASALVSFYVFGIVWKRIKASAADTSADSPRDYRLGVDRRIFPWLYAGSALNVATSLGIGELVTSHLIKFYNAPATTAVAIGALLQAVCVWTQAVFIIVFFSEHIVLDIVLIGVMFCVIGGRLAPLILTLPAVEPYAKHLLALAAFAMGLTSMLLVVRAYLP